tara:strand:- start:3504 stop:5072 length:1569 start_codon:yes stop_codon:yes gene_type:complete
MIRVVLPTAGIGSRLGSITVNFNKALVPIGKKPAISHVIDYYPKDTKFIIALGYKGEDIRTFITLAYPDLNVTFVSIDNYDGIGSGLGYTLKKCEPYIDGPFFFHTNDTIITDKLDFNKFDEDTIFLSRLYIDPKSYVSATINDEKKILKNIYKKTNKKIETPYSYIGIAYIKSFETFKNKLKDNDNGITESDFLIDYLEPTSIRYIETQSWYDIGNIEKYRIAQSELSDFDNLLKDDESIYFVENKVIKYFKNKKIINSRVERSKFLKGLIPNINNVQNNFYSYEYIPGTLLSEIDDIEIEFEKFLLWSKNNLWKSIELNNDQLLKFKADCLDFYYEKTISRVNNFYEKYQMTDQEYLINGKKVQPFENIIKLIDWDDLCNATASGFHGDYHFENILKTGNGYTLLDWRQDFAGNLKYGDIYYDLAKLKHGFIINHGIIKNNLFFIKIGNNNQVSLDFNRKDKLVRVEALFNEFLEKNKLSLLKVNVLTNLIFLNIASLHTYPYSHFLYFLGIKGLNELYE